MLREPGRPQALCLRGEVVQISEHEGRRVIRVAIESGTILDIAFDLPLDMPFDMPSDVHLGDHVLIDASLRITRLQPDIESG